MRGNTRRPSLTEILEGNREVAHHEPERDIACEQQGDLVTALFLGIGDDRQELELDAIEIAVKASVLHAVHMVDAKDGLAKGGDRRRRRDRRAVPIGSD